MKADIIALAQQLAVVPTNALQLGLFYDEALLSLGAAEVIVSAQMIEVTAGEPSYALPADTLRVLTAFYGSKELTQTTVLQLDTITRTWREDADTPVAYLEEHERERTIRLYPTPIVNSDPLDFPNGAPMGIDYPDNMLLVFTIEREDAVPSWLELPMALAILMREFQRASAQRDPGFAGGCAAIAQALRTLAGTP